MSDPIEKNINSIQMVIKDYIIKEKLGTGSYGVVYKVMKKCMYIKINFS